MSFSSIRERDPRTAMLLIVSVALGMAGSAFGLTSVGITALVWKTSDSNCSQAANCAYIALALLLPVLILSIGQIWTTYKIWRVSSYGAIINTTLGVVLLFLAYLVNTLLLANSGLVTGVSNYIFGFLPVTYYVSGSMALASGIIGVIVNWMRMPWERTPQRETSLIR